LAGSVKNFRAPAMLKTTPLDCEIKGNLSGSEPRDKSRVRARRMVGTNWRSRPLGGCRSFVDGGPEADVTGSCGGGRTSPSCDKGTRRRAGANRDTIKQVAWARETNRQPSDAVLPRFRAVRWTQSVGTPEVATVSQCGGSDLTVLDEN
jgi:hypothetical protein